MPKIPDGAKVPEDRKSKAEDVDLGGPFEFEHDGQTYETKRIDSVVTPGFVRRHRSDTDVDVAYTVIEELCDAETLAVIDGMSFADNAKVLAEVGDRVGAFMQAELGRK